MLSILTVLYLRSSHQRILQVMFTPTAAPTFNELNFLYFTHSGLVLKLDIDLPFNGLINPISFGFTHTLDRNSGQLERPVISVADAATGETLVDLILSDTVTFKAGSKVLGIKQDALQLVICDAEAVGSIVRTIINKNLAGFWDRRDDIVVTLSTHCSVCVFGLIVLKGLRTRPLKLSLKDVHDYLFPAPTPSPKRASSITVLEDNPILTPAPAAMLIPTTASASMPPSTKRASGFNGLLPGIAIIREPLATTGVQAILHATMSFSSPPTLDLSLHSLTLGIYMNKVMLTSGVVSPFRIEAGSAAPVAIRIAFNNPRVLREMHLGAAVVDFMNLLARGIGIGVAMVETVAMETARKLTGVNAFASQASVKILRVEGYELGGRAMDVRWLSVFCQQIDLGRDVYLFGGEGAARSPRSSAYGLEAVEEEAWATPRNSSPKSVTEIVEETVFIQRSLSPSEPLPASLLHDYIS
ncbi:hypothetical protein BC830DRAFT_1164239 [Chytriomyces sp. MP71]|nr:hypothetical protein BC830DRAFT_1164239 [Chytriomyces sp. MP71]